MPASRRLRATAVAVALTFTAGVAAAGCGLQLEAAKLTVEVYNQGMRLLPPVHAYRGGEVVITIQNFSALPHQFVLAATNLQPQQFPRSLASALTPQANPAVLDVSQKMKPVSVAPGGAFGITRVTTPSVVTLHEYLHRGYRYVLFDRLAGRYRRVFLVIVVQ